MKLREKHIQLYKLGEEIEAKQKELDTLNEAVVQLAKETACLVVVWGSGQRELSKGVHFAGSENECIDYVNVQTPFWTSGGVIYNDNDEIVGRVAWPTISSPVWRQAVEWINHEAD